MKNYKTTKEYFNLDDDDLLDLLEIGLTKEESLLSDEGKEVVYFDDEKELKDEKHEFMEYIKSKGYAIKATLLTINERIAYVLN